MGFRVQTDLFDVLHRHIMDTEYIPQRGHVRRLDQRGIKKYVNWTEEMAYGRAGPLEYNMANFC